ncbi:hypothetical protein L7F22_054650 [Adiantum nelumboides]|nr:hypothetical protein [Adiantum nelumboides]
MNHVPCEEDQHADASQAAEPEPNKTVANGKSEKSSCVQPDHSGESGDENPGDNSASITDTPEKQYAEEDREDDGFVANVLSQEDEHASRAELTGDDITKNGTFEKVSFGQSTADDCGEENEHANQGDSFISTDTLDQTAPGKHRKDVEVKVGNFVEDDAAISVHTSYRDGTNIIIENVTQEASSTNADSACNTLNNENPVTRTTPAKWQFFYIVRIPRPVEDEKLKNDIALARAKLDEAVLKRDRFQKELREKRVIRAELFEKAKPIRLNERALRVLLQARRAETDSLYQASKKAKNPKGMAGRTCNSEVELDAKIAEMQHKIQHESITLKEEKELLREMKRMESTRGEVRTKSAMMSYTEEGSSAEEIQSQVELLQKDIELVRKDHKVARHESDELDKKLNAVIAEVKALSEQLSEANELQQNAFSALRKLQMQEKLKVEDFMDIWNRDAEFRVEYIKNNEQSTARRLGTLDGRALGEGESPLEIRNAAESLALKSAINAGLPVNNIKEDIKQESTDVGIIHMPKHKKEEINSDVDQVHEEGKQPKVQSKKRVRSHKLGKRPDADIADYTNDEGTVLGNDMAQQQSRKDSMTSMPAREAKYPNGQDAQDAQLIEKLQRGQTAKAKTAEEKRRRRAEKAELKLVQQKAKKEAELAAVAANQSGQLGGSANNILQVQYSVSASAAAIDHHQLGGNVTNEFKSVVKKKQQKRNGKNKNDVAAATSCTSSPEPKPLKPVQRSTRPTPPIKSRGGRNYGPLSKSVALAVLVLIICVVATLTLTYSRLR